MTAAGFRLQARDKSLVRDLFLHRFATRDQILSLGYFCSVPRCNNRMAKLVRSGWVNRIRRVNGLEVSQSLYAAGPASLMWLPECLDMDVQEVRQQVSASAGPMLIEHSVRALDFRLRLLQEARPLVISVDEWRCELECQHAFRFRNGNSPHWRSVVVKPDGFVRLRRDELQVLCFVEIDLGHVALPRFAKKLQSYTDYHRSGAFTEAYGADAFLLLTITTGERRLSHLTGLKAPDGLHFVSTWRRLATSGAFRPSWSNGQLSGRSIFPSLEASS